MGVLGSCFGLVGPHQQAYHNFSLWHHEFIKATWEPSWKKPGPPSRMVSPSPSLPPSLIYTLLYFINILAVVKVTVLLDDINDFTRVNDVYKTCT